MGKGGGGAKGKSGDSGGPTSAQLKTAYAATKQALSWAEDDDCGIISALALKIVVLEGLFSPSDFDKGGDDGGECECAVFLGAEFLELVGGVAGFGGTNHKHPRVANKAGFRGLCYQQGGLGWVDAGPGGRSRGAGAGQCHCAGGNFNAHARSGI